MSRTAVIVLLLVAAALGVLAVIALKPRAGGVAGPLLAGFDPSSVERMEIGEGTRAVTIGLDDRVPGAWVMRWRDAAGVERAWPAASSRVRGAIRLLGDLRVDPGAPALGSEPGTRVALHGAGAGGTPVERVLKLSAGGVAGVTRVAVEGAGGTALGESALLAVFQSAGIEAWREPAVFGTDVSEASRLTIGPSGSQVVLSRVGRSWGMQAPLVVPADEPVVSTVLGALASIGVKQFLPMATPECERALAGETTRIVVETSRRSAAGVSGAGGAPERWTVVQSVTLGGAADVGGRTLFARLEASVEDPRAGTTTPAWGPVFATVECDAVNAVPADAAAYVARVASRTASADIIALTVRRAGGEAAAFERSAAGWHAAPNGAGDMATEEIARALVALVTTERAARVMIGPSLEFGARAELAISGGAGAPPEVFEVGVVSEKGGGADARPSVLAVRSGTVWRLYTGDGVKKAAAYLLRE